MKKFVKVLFCMTAIVCAMVALTACGGVTGKYVNETTMMGVTVKSTIELKSGGKCVLSAKVTGGCGNV